MTESSCERSTEAPRGPMNDEENFQDIHQEENNNVHGEEQLDDDAIPGKTAQNKDMHRNVQSVPQVPVYVERPACGKVTHGRNIVAEHLGNTHKYLRL